MADIKFSQFTNQTDYTNVTDIVGYDGASNVRITPSNFISSWNEQQSTIAFSTTGAGAVTTIDVGKITNTDTDFNLLANTSTSISASYKINGEIAIAKSSTSWALCDSQILTTDGSLGGFEPTTISLNDSLSFGGGSAPLSQFLISPDPTTGEIKVKMNTEEFARRAPNNDPTNPGQFTIGSDSEIAWTDSVGTLTLLEDVVFTKNGSSSSTAPNSISSISVGTGGAATKGAVEVAGFIDYDLGAPFNYFLSGATNTEWLYFTGTGSFAISYYGEGRFLGSGIHIFSDERIKKDVSVSDSKQDLETISKIEISNYKHIDEAHGDRVHKKVIAQQVVKHYPEAVAIGKEVVPCIYEKSTIEDGVIKINVDNCGSDACCKLNDKVKLIYPDGSKELVNIIESDGDSIKVDSDKSGEVFVYGKEVDDYHSVDYDALAMLNISATQELYKIIKELKEEIKELKK